MLAGEVVCVDRGGRRILITRDDAEPAVDRIPDYSDLLVVPSPDDADRWGWEWSEEGDLEPTSGNLEIRHPGFVDAISADPRFVVDEPPLLALVEKAVPLTWTRDPFDRLLAAHSEARRVPLCTLDRRMRREHRFMVQELRHARRTSSGRSPVTHRISGRLAG